MVVMYLCITWIYVDIGMGYKVFINVHLFVIQVVCGKEGQYRGKLQLVTCC